MLISEFTIAKIKITSVFVNISKCTVNMNKKGTTVFSLNNINKD